jgi:hypothetical protein
MRYLPTRQASPKPMQVKGQVSKVKHFGAPTKGLYITNDRDKTDPLTAGVLTNYVLIEDRIRCRPGTKKIATVSALPVEMLMAYGATAGQVLAASGGSVYLASTAALIHSGFTSNDWSWTMFANLSSQKFLVMVNGKNGLWSYNGTTMVKETVTAPVSAPHIIPDNMNIVIVHMNRLFFADTANLSVYYLPVQTKSGELLEIPIGSLFRKGGTIRALGTWTIDGGAGMDDHLAIFTDHGEVAIYSGIDPASDFRLVGIYKLDAPMSKHSLAGFGGELYLMVSYGLVPMSVMLRETYAESEWDTGVISEFRKMSSAHSAKPGWQVALDNETGHFICNMPHGAPNSYCQMVRKMQVSKWVKWRDVPARCWVWLDGRLYFGDDLGNVFDMDAVYTNDDGHAIKTDLQLGWDDFGSAVGKHFKMVRPFLITDGVPRPRIEVRTDYDTSEPVNEPDVTFSTPGAIWDEAIWAIDEADELAGNGDYWAQGPVNYAEWQGCAASGKVGAIRMTMSINGAEFEVTGFDVVYENGSILG